MFRASQIPNCICVLRILLVLPIVLCLLSGEWRWALLLIFTAGFSDALDGFLAKRFDWRTRLGGLLDPIADKLLLVSVFLTLAYLGTVPVWLAAVVVGRDLVIISGALAFNTLIRPVKPEPSKISKLNTSFQLIYILFVISSLSFGWPQPISVTVTGAGVLVTSVVSGLDYVVRWSRRAASGASKAGRNG
jgi:cardiolipin synthase